MNIKNTIYFLIFSNMAAIHAGGFTGGMYLTNTASACEYIAKDSRANIIVVGDQKQLDKILSIKDNLPDLKAIVMFDGESSVPGVISWDQLLKIGELETSQNTSALA